MPTPAVGEQARRSRHRDRTRRDALNDTC